MKRLLKWNQDFLFDTEKLSKIFEIKYQKVKLLRKMLL
jgi:hypothetical protein